MSSESTYAEKETESPRRDTSASSPERAINGNYVSIVAAGYLGHEVMEHPANAEIRTIAMRRARQASGSVFIQRSIQRKSSSRLIQRECSCGGACAACQAKALEEEEQRVVQRQAIGEVNDDRPPEGHSSDEDIIPADIPGHPLDQSTRDFMEPRFGEDFSDVRVHTDSRAAKSANALQADAYTAGRDVYFAEGKYEPNTDDGRHLLAHELTHTVQQSNGAAPVATKHSGGVLVGDEHDSLEAEAEKTADAVTDNSPAPSVELSQHSQDNSPRVRRSPRSGVAGWNSVSDNPLANSLASGVRRGVNFVASQVERFAPGAIAFFRNARDFFKNAIPRGVDTVFGDILTSLREKGLAATLATMIGSIAAGAMHAVGGFAAGHCAAIGRLADYLLDVASKLGSSVLDQARKGFESIRGPLEDIWNEYGAPAVDWIKKKLKSIWQGVEETATRIWNLLKPLREGLASVWNEVTSFLIEGHRAVSEWLEWLLPKAIDVWEEVKRKIRPHMEEVKNVAKIVAAAALLLSPAGPFLLVAAAVYGLYEGAKALWDKWGKPKTREIREWWVNYGLPFARNKLGDLRTRVEGLKQRIQTGLQQVSNVFMRLLSALGVFSFLASVKAVISSVSQKIEIFRGKLDGEIEFWSQKLHLLLLQADPFLRLIHEAFRQSLLIALLGPFAFLDDGVWNTLNTFVSFASRTPCLRELAGLLNLPSNLQRLGNIREGIKQALEVIRNPDPLLEKLKIAVAPLVARIEPQVRSGVEQLSSAFTERDQMIQLSILHYLASSLSELRTNWWEQLKKIGGDLLWPWSEVAKDFIPMLEDFGSAISSIFDLEFSTATDKFLSGMKKFNGIAGALSGWFLVASVLIGATLGALGFAFGPAGVATVGAGASAGLAFAEEVGMGLLLIAVATESAVMLKAKFDLYFQNPRIRDEQERQDADQEDCKAIAGSLISLITIGALMVLADIAAKFAKFLYSLVEDVPIVRDISTLLKDIKEAVSEFGPNRRGGPRAELPSEPTATRPAEHLPEDPAPGAKDHDIPREQLDAEAGELRQKAANPDNVRRPTDPHFDAEMDAEGHTFDRDASDRTWCRFTKPSCNLDLGGDLNHEVDTALNEKRAGPRTDEGPAPEVLSADPRAKANALEETYRPILEDDTDLRLRLKQLQIDLADPATAADATKRLPPLEDELIESAIARLERRRPIDPTKLGQLREHLRQHPEDLGRILDLEPDEFPSGEEPRFEGNEPPAQSDRMDRIRNGELVDVTGFTNPPGEQLNIDPNYRPPEDALGRTNAERGRDGLAPILPSGESVVLHHSTQDFFSPLDEHSARFHQSVLNDPNFHPMTGDPAYLSWRGEVALYRGRIRPLGEIYDLIRSRYWRARFAGRTGGGVLSPRPVQRKYISPRLIQRECSCGGTCAACQQTALEEHDQQLVQRQATREIPDVLSLESRSSKTDIIPADGRGHPLNAPTRGFMEPRFGQDFSDVRVHTDTQAAESAEALQANAYTTGRDIYFAAGKYAPGNDEGRRLLAHELTHTIQQQDNAAACARKSASADNLKIDPDDSLEQDAERVADMIMRMPSASGTIQRHQKLSAPQSPAPIQRAPKPAPQSSQTAADPAVVQNAVDAVCKGIDDDSVDAVVAPMRGLSISAGASLRSGVLMRKMVLLERWLLKPHGDQKKFEDIASIALITVPSVVVRTNITATAEEGLRLLWPALPLIDRLEVYDEGFREIEQAQLDVIREASLKERAEAQKQAAVRLFAVYSKMSAKEEFEARNLMDSSEVAKGDTAVRMIQRGDKDVVYDALMALDRIDRKFVFDQHYMELKDLLYHDEFNLVAALTHGSEVQMIIARLRLATEDRSDDMEAVRAMVDHAVALLTERQQLRQARSARLLTADDRAHIDARLHELDDLDLLLQFKRTNKGNLKENTFMALLADAENKQAAFGSHMNRLAQFSSNPRAFALDAAKQRVLIAGSHQDDLRNILLTTHAPVDPKDKTKRSELKQWEEDVEFRKELLRDPQVHKVFVGLVESEQMHVLTAVTGDAFNEALERLNQMKNSALWGEFFDLIRTVAQNEAWRDRFEKTKTEYWSLYSFVFGEEREIMETILRDPEHKIPIIRLLRYTGKVSTLKAAFAHIQENEREQLRTGWAMANHPFIGPRTEQQDSALAAFKQFEAELKKSQGSDKEGYETILATVLGTAPTKSEMATGEGRYNAAAILAQRVEKRLGLTRGIAADFSETDETMDAAGRQFYALWLRLKDKPEISIVEYATLSTLYQLFEHRAEEFSEAAKAITDMAGTIAATLAGIVVVVATGGAATPAVVAMAAAAGAAGGLVAREAFGGDYYTAMNSDGGRALLLDSLNGALAVLSGSLAARGVELTGLSGRALAQGMARVGEGAVQEAAQSLGRKALVSGVEAALDGMISGTISEAAVTFTDDRTWREGIMEGLSRVGKSALLGGLFGLAGGVVLGAAMPVAGRAIGGLRKALTASTLEKSIIRAGMEDMLKSAQAAARKGDIQAVERLSSHMEASLAPEEAALLRQQLRDKLAEVLGHPPGRAALVEGEEKLLASSGRKESGLTDAELNAERDVVSRSEPQSSLEPGYVDEVDLGNGHTWRRTDEGTWCRFTLKTLCGTEIPGAPPFRGRARTSTPPPYDWPVKKVDYATLPRDAARNIEALPEGIVYEFPGGHRVWREGDIIRHESVLGPRIGRQHFEKEMFSASELGRPEVKGMERAHTLGQGTGFESPFGILLAPREVNQIIQNNGIEEFLRGLSQSAHPGEAFHVSTLTVPHPGSLRLKEIRYRVEVARNGKKDFLFEYTINVGDIPNASVTHGVADITQNREIAHYIDLVDVPERLRSRFQRFRRGSLP